MRLEQVLEVYDLPIGNIATLDGLAQLEANDVVVAAVDDVAVVEAAAEGTIEGAVRAGDFAGGEGAELGRRIWAEPPPLCGQFPTRKQKDR
jgi:hypothetical protein